MSLLPRFLQSLLLIVSVAAPAFAETAPPPPAMEIHAQGRPELVFACDRPTDQLDALFTPTVVADLVALHAGIALSTEDFTPARAQVAKRLSSAGVRLYAWIVLAHADGYYVNAANAAQTSVRFDAFDQWSHDNDLHWAAVGLDIEPRLTEFAGFQDHKLQLVATLVRRAFDGARAEKARTDYTALVHRMQQRGYRVQTHQLPFIADARKVHTTLLERTLGIVDVRGDDEVLMLYTSFNHDTGAGIIWAYGPDAQTIAIGSTASSGDAATDARVPPLNWDEFTRDLIVAAHFSKLVGIYSLEGCVHQGFLPRLRALDWSAPVSLPSNSIHAADLFRERVQHLLWLLPRLPYINGALLLLLIAAIVLVVRRRRRRRRRALQPDRKAAI